MIFTVKKGIHEVLWYRRLASVLSLLQMKEPGCGTRMCSDTEPVDVVQLVVRVDGALRVDPGPLKPGPMRDPVTDDVIEQVLKGLQGVGDDILS